MCENAVQPVDQKLQRNESKIESKFQKMKGKKYNLDIITIQNECLDLSKF